MIDLLIKIVLTLILAAATVFMITATVTAIRKPSMRAGALMLWGLAVAFMILYRLLWG